MSITNNMKINSDRLRDSIMQIAKIGPGVAAGVSANSGNKGEILCQR